MKPPHVCNKGCFYNTALHSASRFCPGAARLWSVVLLFGCRNDCFVDESTPLCMRSLAKTKTNKVNAP
jgi:hypothetical protein